MFIIAAYRGFVTTENEKGGEDFVVVSGRVGTQRSFATLRMTGWERFWLMPILAGTSAVLTIPRLPVPRHGYHKGQDTSKSPGWATTRAYPSASPPPSPLLYTSGSCRLVV